MREIKFRGKRKDNGEWVYGDVIHFPSTTAIGHPDKDGVCWEEYDVIPETVGQSTGLKDKNDKEIYDGDIVHFLDPKSPSRPKVHKSIVQWFQEGCSYECAIINSNKSCGLYKLAQNQIEVIGNIHDNPDKKDTKTNQGPESARGSVGPADSDENSK